jgi:crotonobetaine/carnitine-CoA ligase
METAAMSSSASLPGHESRKPWETSLGEFLDLAVARSPDKVFLEISGQEFTYDRFQRRVLQTAAAFRAMGVGKGDRVCLLLPNCPEFLLCWFGLSALGAISVPINTAYKRDETAYILNDAEATALVAHHSLLPVAQEAADLVPGVRVRLVAGGDPPVHPPLPGGVSDWANFDQALSGSAPLGTRPEVAPEDCRPSAIMGHIGV